MESEKVKEIKKGSEDNIKDHLPYIDGDKCKFLLYADIITYINELESENERLDKVVKHNQELIENGKLVSSEQLKQFAEKVKMEFYYEFDELIPSIMSDKIDKILKEILGENNE